MSDDVKRAEIATKRVVYQMDGAREVTVRRDVPYRAAEADALTLDIYNPPARMRGGPVPVVLFVTGYPDRGMQSVIGCKAKEMESYISWATLMAASGLIAVTYTAAQPASDVNAVLEHLRRNADTLGLDAARIGVWSCSGNAPNALSILMNADVAVTCAALCYPYMLDLDGSTAVAEAANMFRFAHSSAGKSVRDLPEDLPLFIARAGRDEMPHVNETIDRFAVHALRLNRPVTLVNHHTGPHAFDLLDDSDTSRAIIRQVLAFMTYHLRVA